MGWRGRSPCGALRICMIWRPGTSGRFEPRRVSPDRLFFVFYVGFAKKLDIRRGRRQPAHREYLVDIFFCIGNDCQGMRIRRPTARAWRRGDARWLARRSAGLGRPMPANKPRRQTPDKTVLMTRSLHSPIFPASAGAGRHNVPRRPSGANQRRHITRARRRSFSRKSPKDEKGWLTDR